MAACTYAEQRDTNMSELQPSSLQQLETLHNITKTLNTSLDLDVVLNNVMDQVVKVTGAERGFLMLFDDDGELRFQVARGMDQRDLATPEFDVSKTILEQVINSREPLLTINAQSDVRLGTESIVTKGLLSILCVPITRREELIGLVYLDNRLKTGLFTESHRYLVTAFASEAGFAIENARLYQLAVERGRMQRELEMARSIQQGLLIQRFTPISGYDVAFSWEAAYEVAGDFFDCLHLVDDQMGIVVADVSDKGAAAAIFMAVARSLFRGNAYTSADPDEAIQRTNSTLVNDASQGMFVTLYYCMFGPKGRMRGVNAGHNQPLHYRAATNSVEWLPRGGRPLGWFENIPLQVQDVTLGVGDVIVLYTDGLTEAENLDQDQYSKERLADIVQHYHDQPAESIKGHVLADVHHFQGEAPAFDDLTLVIVRYSG